MTAISGVATFSTLSINKVGVGYTLTAADGSLAEPLPARSTSGRHGNAAGVRLQPSNTTAGATIARR